jgi:hypothetical protein
MSTEPDEKPINDEGFADDNEPVRPWTEGVAHGFAMLYG